MGKKFMIRNFGTATEGSTVPLKFVVTDSPFNMSWYLIIQMGIVFAIYRNICDIYTSMVHNTYKFAFPEVLKEFLPVIPIS